MTEQQMFNEEVRRSRVFVRRRMIERFAAVQLRDTGGVNAPQIVRAVEALMAEMVKLEDAEMAS